MTSVEHECERHFLRIVKRNKKERFVITLSMKVNGTQQLGESRYTALSRFSKLERRFKYNVQLKENYSQFMKEYLDSRYMQAIDEQSSKNATAEFYLPHHAVLKKTSVSTKLRVMFDGSCKFGCSAKDILLVGPVVQFDLISILLKFRTFKYVFTSDIVKMYRQILVQHHQISLQRILWRENDNEPITTYELKTLTYDTASASYIAIRCFKYLAELNLTHSPLGAKAIISDCYVNNLLTGVNSLEEAIIKRNQIIKSLQSGQFKLSKCSANHPRLLEDLSRTSLPQDTTIIDKNVEFRILEIQWASSENAFSFTINRSTASNKVTKRTIVSEIAQLFDPLGLLGLIILTAKLMI